MDWKCWVMERIFVPCFSSRCEPGHINDRRTSGRNLEGENGRGGQRHKATNPLTWSKTIMKKTKQGLTKLSRVDEGFVASVEALESLGFHHAGALFAMDVLEVPIQMALIRKGRFAADFGAWKRLFERIGDWRSHS